MKQLGFFLFALSIPVNVVACGLILAQNRTGVSVWLAGLALWGAGMLITRADTKEDN